MSDKVEELRETVERLRGERDDFEKAAFDMRDKWWSEVQRRIDAEAGIRHYLTHAPKPLTATAEGYWEALGELLSEQGEGE